MPRKLNWLHEDYFIYILSTDIYTISKTLELIVEDIHLEKQKTINRLLSHQSSEKILWRFLKNIESKSARIAGNIAYVIGTVAEFEVGSSRILSLVKKHSKDKFNVLDALTQMLQSDDVESVTNAAGTIGTMAESAEGRAWMLSESCIDQLIKNVTGLLPNKNLWTASNAALVLARLSISDEGNCRLLNHFAIDQIITLLIDTLGLDEAGRGMNAAFALGRLCDSVNGVSALAKISQHEQMIANLYEMLKGLDVGASKNSCFCLGCLAGTVDGHNLLLSNVGNLLEGILQQLALRLHYSIDEESAWFSAMCLRVIASRPRGCALVREHQFVVNALKECISDAKINADVKEEALATLQILKPLDKPLPPDIEILNASEIRVHWVNTVLKSGFQVMYHLYQDSSSVYDGYNTECLISNLQPCTTYAFNISLSTEIEMSPMSDAASLLTEESIPSQPLNLRLLVVTSSQVKICWEPPQRMNGIFKIYHVFNGDKIVQNTTELNAIVSGLAANSTYELSVCASTTKGKGPCSIISITTNELGPHAPSRPSLTVIGRQEIGVSWEPPEQPLGRITRYEVKCQNLNRIVYSGTDLCCRVRDLQADTEYSFTVMVVTSDGKCESKMNKKRTAKEEYMGPRRAPLYDPSFFDRRDSISSSTSSANLNVRLDEPQQQQQQQTKPCSAGKRRTTRRSKIQKSDQKERSTATDKEDGGVSVKNEVTIIDNDNHSQAIIDTAASFLSNETGVKLEDEMAIKKRSKATKIRNHDKKEPCPVQRRLTSISLTSNPCSVERIKTIECPAAFSKRTNKVSSEQQRKNSLPMNCTLSSSAENVYVITASPVFRRSTTTFMQSKANSNSRHANAAFSSTPVSSDLLTNDFVQPAPSRMQKSLLGAAFKGKSFVPLSFRQLCSSNRRPPSYLEPLTRRCQSIIQLGLNNVASNSKEVISAESVQNLLK